MEGHSLISSDVLASYAADAARETAGVIGLVDSPLHRHKGVRVAEQEGRVTVELHLVCEWGASLPDVGRSVQRRVVEYLGRMADVRPTAVNVVFDEVGA
jgi:uncharacterized alkaline shock family protein YloU